MYHLLEEQDEQQREELKVTRTNPASRHRKASYLCRQAAGDEPESRKL
jgi:hypothetical protein